MEKKVSVIMSTYNEKEEELKAAVNSMLNQSYENLELIIVLDAPNNQLLKNILLEFQAKDSRVKIHINEDNIGLALSLNKAIEMSSGDYIARMDADDISFMDRIEKEVLFLENNEDYVMVATNKEDIDENGRILPSNYKVVSDYNKVKNIMRFKSIIIHPSILIRKKVLVEVNGYRNFDTSQDYDLWLRLLTLNYKIKILDEKLIYYRKRSNSISIKNPFRQYINHKYALLLYKQRINNGIDNFSEENKNKFLVNNGYFNTKKQSNFNKGFRLLYDGVRLIKSKRIINGLLKITYALSLHREIATELYLAIRFKKMLKNDASN